MAFFLGNIGPVEGFQSNTSKPKKEQLFGCLKEFYVNNKKVKFEKVLGYFSSFCDNLYENLKLPANSLSLNSSNVNCSFSTTEEQNQISKSRLSLNKIENDTKEWIGSTEKYTFLKLSWKHSSDDNYCLIQMKYENHSLVIQVLQSYLNMVLFSKHEEYQRKILHKVWNDSINLLTIRIKSRDQLSLKVTDKRFSTEFSLFFEEEFQSMIIGSVDIKNVCRTFSGKLNIGYVASDFQKKRMRKKFGFYLKIILPVTISVIIIFGAFVFFLWRFFVLKPPNKIGDGELHLNYEENPVYDFTMEHVET